MMLSSDQERFLAEHESRQFGTAEQFMTILRRALPSHLRANQGLKGTPEAELVLHILQQGWKDLGGRATQDWWFKDGSGFHYYCDILGLSVQDLRDYATRANQAYFASIHNLNLGPVVNKMNLRKAQRTLAMADNGEDVVIEDVENARLIVERAKKIPDLPRIKTRKRIKEGVK